MWKLDPKTTDAKVKVKVAIAASITIAVLVLAFCLWFFVQKDTERYTESASMQEHSPPEPSFDDFIGVWNGIARSFDLAGAHKLSSVSNEKLLKSLRGYIEFYNHPLPDSINQPLNEIVQEYPGSLWRYYRDFLVAHIGKHHVSQTLWSSFSTSADLRTLVLQTTGLSDMDESVKLIQGASDPSAYFFLYKYDLWDRGLSRNMQSCGMDIIDSAKFPSLAKLIRK